MYSCVYGASTDGSYSNTIYEISGGGCGVAFSVTDDPIDEFFVNDPVTVFNNNVDGNLCIKMNAGGNNL
jgi:hypothetical protein